MVMSGHLKFVIGTDQKQQTDQTAKKLCMDHICSYSCKPATMWSLEVLSDRLTENTICACVLPFPHA